MSDAPGSALADVLDAVRPTAGRARIRLDAFWAQGRTIFGGLTGAVLMRAMQASLPTPRPARSLHVSFVGPVAPGEVEVEVEVLREGSRVTHVQGALRTDGRIGAVAHAAFGVGKPAKLAIEGVAAPEVPAPESLVRMPPGPPAPRFLEHFDMRWTTGAIPFSGARGRTIGGWCRPLGRAEVDAATIVALVDLWPASVLPNLGTPAPVSSVTWAMDFAAPPEVLASSDWLYEAHTEAAADGYALSRAYLWDRSGRLAVASRQVVAIFERPPQA